jgi:hypothetical protein
MLYSSQDPQKYLISSVFVDFILITKEIFIQFLLLENIFDYFKENKFTFHKKMVYDISKDFF